MTRTPDASAALPASAPATRQDLLALLAAGDIDSALDAGLMDYAACGAGDEAPLLEAQQRLRQAWAARARYRARQARLAAREAERDARRRPAAAAAAAVVQHAPSSTCPSPSPSSPTTAAVKPALPALPAAAAAALARARAKAAGRDAG